VRGEVVAEEIVVRGRLLKKKPGGPGFEVLLHGVSGLVSRRASNQFRFPQLVPARPRAFFFWRG